MVVPRAVKNFPRWDSGGERPHGRSEADFAELGAVSRAGANHSWRWRDTAGMGTRALAEKLSKHEDGGASSHSGPGNYHVKRKKLQVYKFLYVLFPGCCQR